MKTHIKATLAISLAMLGLVSQSQAATALVLTGTGTNNNHTGVLGGTFTAHSSGTAVINRLGFYDHGGDGLTVGHDVGLYLWNEVDQYILQVKATIPAGTTATLEGGFRWVDIAPLTLSTTTTARYLVYASTTANDGDLWGVTSTYDSAIGAPVTAWYGSDPIGALGSAADLDGAGGNGFLYNAGNIGYAVPEPGSALLGGLGLLALLRRRR
jgi:hypothetical protein